MEILQNRFMPSIFTLVLMVIDRVRSTSWLFDPDDDTLRVDPIPGGELGLPVAAPAGMTTRSI